MPWQCIDEFRVVEQFANFSANLPMEFARGIRDLLENGRATVKDRYDVFEVAARIEVSPSSPPECLQFCPMKYGVVTTLS